MYVQKWVQVIKCGLMSRYFELDMSFRRLTDEPAARKQDQNDVEPKISKTFTMARFCSHHRPTATFQRTNAAFEGCHAACLLRSQATSSNGLAATRADHQVGARVGDSSAGTLHPSKFLLESSFLCNATKLLCLKPLEA